MRNVDQGVGRETGGSVERGEVSTGSAAGDEKTKKKEREKRVRQRERKGKIEKN